MRNHRAQWILSGVFGLMILGVLAGPTWAADSTSTVPVAPVAALPVVSPQAVGTTIPVAPSVLIGLPDGPPQPPPVRPVFKATPPPEGAVTYVGLVPKDTRVGIPALWAFGRGEIRIQGDCSVQFSGEGMLWADKGTSVVLDPATTFTKSLQRDGVQWDKFRGTTRMTGSPLNVEIKGDRLMVTANGSGKVTLGGEGGMFRLLHTGGELISGVWDQKGVTEEFAKAEKGGVQKPSPKRGAKYNIGGGGLLPAIPPPVKVVTPRPLPTVSTGTARTAAPAPKPAQSIAK